MTSPRIIVHDVLQTSRFSKSQLNIIENKGMRSWFNEMLDILDGYDNVTLAVLASGIYDDISWVNQIKLKKRWKIETHGWDHYEYNRLSEHSIKDKLLSAKKLLEATFNQPVTIFYPPRHKTNDKVEEITYDIGLKVVVNKNVPENWLEDNSVDEFYIHYWNHKHLSEIKEILKLVKGNKDAKSS